MRKCIFHKWIYHNKTVGISGMYETYRCKKCGIWMDKIHAIDVGWPCNKLKYWEQIHENRKA